MYDWVRSLLAAEVEWHRSSEADGTWINETCRDRGSTLTRGFAVCCLALALGSSAAVAQSGRVQRGLTFAQTNCSQCHAIGRLGESSIPEAPPFRTLHTRYPVGNLAEAFAEGITTGHPSMPEFRLDPAQINDLLAYLNSIQE